MRYLWLLAAFFTLQGSAKAQNSCAEYTNRPSACESRFRCYFSEGYCQEGRRANSICSGAQDLRRCNTGYPYKGQCFWNREQSRCKPKVNSCSDLDRTNRQVCEGYDPKLDCEWDRIYSSCRNERSRGWNECTNGKVFRNRICVDDPAIPTPVTVKCARYTDARICSARYDCSWQGNACGPKVKVEVCKPDEYLQANGSCLKPSRRCGSYRDIGNCISGERKNYCTWLSDDGDIPSRSINNRRNTDGKCRAQSRFGGSRW